MITLNRRSNNVNNYSVKQKANESEDKHIFMYHHCSIDLDEFNKKLELAKPIIADVYR
jgi:hypothetical protein